MARYQREMGELDRAIAKSIDLERIADALERIADTLASLDEPQTFEMETNPHGLTVIREKG